MSGTWRRAITTTAIFIGATGCIAPPVLMPRIGPLPTDPMQSFPRGTELVEIPIEGDAHLGGVFVPSDPGSPVVLHLLESGAGAIATRPAPGARTSSRCSPTSASRR